MNEIFRVWRNSSILSPACDKIRPVYLIHEWESHRVVLPPPQDPDSTASAGSAAFHLHMAGVAASFVFAAVFFAISYQKDLRWTPLVVVALGLFTILFIQRRRLVRFEQQLGAWMVYVVAIGACFFVESQRLLVHPPPPPPPPPKIAVAIDDLVGSFTGFHKKETGERTFVVLVIEEVNRTPSRVFFRYSLNENTLRRTQGQGLIYPSSTTLQLADGTIFRYERDENGKLVLWSINRHNFRLSRISDQH